MSNEADGLVAVQLLEARRQHRRGAVIRVDPLRAAKMLEVGLACHPGEVPDDEPNNVMQQETPAPRRSRRRRKKGDSDG